MVEKLKWYFMNTTKNYILLILALVVGAYAFGRYSAPVKIETHTITVEKEIKVKDTETQDHSKTTIVIKKDGTKIITKQNDIDTKVKSTDNIDIKQDSTKIITNKHPILTIQAMMGYDFNSADRVYGASASKNFIGPLRFGVFMLSNKTVGITMGIDF